MNILSLCEFDNTCKSVPLNKLSPYDPAIPPLGLYPKKRNTGSQRGICTLMFMEALFTIAKIWTQPKCPQWMTA